MERLCDLLLHQERLTLYAIVVGLVILVAGKTVPHKILAKVSTWPYCSPNWITFWGVIIFYISLGFYLLNYYAVMYFTECLPLATLLYFISESMDFLDGRMSKSMQIHGIPRTEISIERGTWGDPLADKIRHLPAIACLMFASVFSLYIAVPVILVDVVGTFVRKPFTKKPFTRYKVFQFIKEHLRQSKASNVGKIKSLFHGIAIAVAVFYHQAWIEPGSIPNILLGVALVFGVLSVISRARISREVDQVIDDVHAVF